jgi:hypothetical protein
LTAPADTITDATPATWPEALLARWSAPGVLSGHWHLRGVLLKDPRLDPELALVRGLAWVTLDPGNGTREVSRQWVELDLETWDHGAQQITPHRFVELRESGAF